MPKKEKVTLDVLARMMQNQFRETATKDDLKEMATKDDLQKLEGRIDKRFDGVDARFDTVDSRLNTIEALLASNRIERLEDSVRQIKTLLKIR